MLCDTEQCCQQNNNNSCCPPPELCDNTLNRSSIKTPKLHIFKTTQVWMNKDKSVMVQTVFSSIVIHCKTTTLYKGESNDNLESVGEIETPL